MPPDYLHTWCGPQSMIHLLGSCWALANVFVILQLFSKKGSCPSNLIRGSEYHPSQMMTLLIVIWLDWGRWTGWSWEIHIEDACSIRRKKSRFLTYSLQGISQTISYFNAEHDMRGCHVGDIPCIWMDSLEQLVSAWLICYPHLNWREVYASYQKLNINL